LVINFQNLRQVSESFHCFRIDPEFQNRPKVSESRHSFRIDLKFQNILCGPYATVVHYRDEVMQI